ncbi:acyl-CoA dehydrogenase [Streptomyces sp. NRRL WC-3742]|uniref:acyl-CoA dehydrogenase n=1 Tax=Streptomyces sp. NRRL WC-3742 TaxID=1463934 RepID=UPI000690535C|nr:acyl-CoA dehydrogenase [Streptomyces sp. NRRL WC-3742]
MIEGDRITRLEKAFGPLFSADNPMGQHGLLAADARGEVLAEAERVLDEFGFNAEFVPAELDGRLTRLDELGRVLRPVFRRDASLGFGYGLSCFFAAVPVWAGGDGGQRALAARLLLEGRRIAVVRHEVAHGNAFVREEFAAEPKAGGFVLNGTKSVIANARTAGGLVVFARTGGEVPGRAHSVLLLDREALPEAAVEYLGRHDTTGMRSVEFGGIRVTDCPVPGSALVGGLGEGYELSLRSSLVIRGLIPSIVLAGGDTALRTVARFATRRRADGRSSLDVQHVKDVLTGAFLDLLVSDCLSLVATRALHLLPKQMSAYAATAAYLAPKLVAEAMEEMSAVLGEETFAEDGAYAMFRKQLRDLPVTSLGHAGSAGRQVSILPQLPFFARHAWFADPEAPPALFRLEGDLPPLSLADAALLGDGDPLAATLVACTDQLENGGLLSDAGPDGPALRFLARAFTIELDDLRKAFTRIALDDRKAMVSPHAFGQADRYTLVLAAAACLGVWREQRDGEDDFLADPSWVTAALYRLGRRLGLPLPDRPSGTEQRVLAEVLARLHGRRSLDLYGSALA